MYSLAEKSIGKLCHESYGKCLLGQNIASGFRVMVAPQSIQKFTVKQ